MCSNSLEKTNKYHANSRAYAVNNDLIAIYIILRTKIQIDEQEKEMTTI